MTNDRDKTPSGLPHRSFTICGEIGLVGYGTVTAGTKGKVQSRVECMFCHAKVAGSKLFPDGKHADFGTLDFKIRHIHFTARGEPTITMDIVEC